MIFAIRTTSFLSEPVLISVEPHTPELKGKKKMMVEIGQVRSRLVKITQDCSRLVEVVGRDLEESRPGGCENLEQSRLAILIVPVAAD